MMPENQLPAEFKTQLDVIVPLVVHNRNQAANKEVMFLYKETTTDFYGYFRLNLDMLNTFWGDDNQNFNENRRKNC